MSAIPPKATVRCAGHDDVGRGRRHRRDRAAAFTPKMPSGMAATVPARPATCACDDAADSRYSRINSGFRRY